MKRNEILQYLSRHGKMPAEALGDALGVDKETLSPMLEELRREGYIISTTRGTLALPGHLGYMRGTYCTTGGDAAFFSPDDGAPDHFVHRSGRLNAMHGDVVFARLTRRGRAGDVELVRVVKRAYTEITGVYHANRRGGYIECEIHRSEMAFDLMPHTELQPQSGDLVLARIETYPDDYHIGTATLLEILGPQGLPRAEYRAILHRHGFSDVFPSQVLQQAALLTAAQDDPAPYRRDFTDTCIVTIDGADAKDLDDAVSLQIIDGQYHLGVYIADVSSYVHPNDAVDAEALQRGTSVYFPGAVFPMLPATLSDDLCSLQPNTRKRVLACLMILDGNGQVLQCEVVPGYIVSRARLCYDDVNALLQGNDTAAMASEVVQMLRNMDVLREKRTALRMARGALDLEINEPQIDTDAQGYVRDVRIKPRGNAERLIEEFMLCANECVAEYLQQAQAGCVYRVHDVPDAEKAREIGALVHQLRLPVSPKGARNTPQYWQTLLQDLRQTRYSGLFQHLILRSMKRAVYTTANRGHFGLASACYCHFTSPIRRYPDLLVHRQVYRLLQGKAELPPALEEMAAQASRQERSAMEAERDADAWQIALYMKAQLGNEFEGIISGVTEYGLYVSLACGAEGFVPVRTLRERYRFDARRYALRAERSRKHFMLGDAVRVRVAAVSVEKRTVTLQIVS